MYEQFPYQTGLLEELARTHSILVDYTLPGSVFVDEKWVEIFGVNLSGAIASTFVLYAIACNNAGKVSGDLVNDAETRIWEILSRNDVQAVLDCLTSTIEEARAHARRVPGVRWSKQRYAFNPLLHTPFIRVAYGLLYAPQPKFVIWSVTLEALYYRALKAWGPDFSAELGLRVEGYIGQQLSQVGVPLLPEISWAPGKGLSKKSVDWFLVTGKYVVLIESKSARMSLDAKAGGQSYPQIINRYIGYAVEQINFSDGELTDDNPAFAEIPKDRKRLGLVVTAEPFYYANSLGIRQILPVAKVPTMVASLRDIELLSVLSEDELDQVFDGIWLDPELSTWNLTNAMKEVIPVAASRRNRLIDEAYMKVFNFIPDESAK